MFTPDDPHPARGFVIFATFSPWPQLGSFIVLLAGDLQFFLRIVTAASSLDCIQFFGFVGSLDRFVGLN